MAGSRTTNEPPIVVAGVGHSGTTIVTRMLVALGWDGLDADEEYCESVRFRELNEHAWREGYLPEEAWTWAESLPDRWVVKDPRLAIVLPMWVPVFAETGHRPVLLWVWRMPNAVILSHQRRGRKVTMETVIFGRPLSEHFDMMEVWFDQWPWGKVHVDIARLAMAIRLFDPERVLA